MLATSCILGKFYKVFYISVSVVQDADYLQIPQQAKEGEHFPIAQNRTHR